MTTLLTLLAGVLVVLLITAVTGYFVAQEFAYMAVDRSELNVNAAAGDTAAGRALTITRRTSFMLSGAQLGITVTGLLVGYVAEPLIGDSLGTILGGAGVPTAVGVGAVLALLFSTIVQMLFGELFPKSFAIARPGPVARRLARSTAIYLKLFGWLIRVFDQASTLLLRALRVEPVHDIANAATARDLQHIVESSRQSGDLPEELSMLLDRILDFPHRNVEHAMISRSRVATVEDDITVGQVRELMTHGHSRYPVLAAGTQDVVGVVHLADLLATAEADSAPGTALARPALVVSHLSALPDVLRQLGESRNQMACVVDEYGGFTGVITLEDLAEELVGEITDEHDAAAQAYVPVEGDGIWEMSADVHVDEVERALGTNLPRGDYETIAGFVIAAHGGLPARGATLEIELPLDLADLAHDDEPTRRVLRLEVLAIDRHVPSRVRLVLPDIADAAAAVSASESAAVRTDPR